MIERSRWRVLISTPTTDGTEPVTTEHTVEVGHRDQLQAERTAAQFRIDIDRTNFPLTWNTVVVYCALMRTGAYRGTWAAFNERDLVDLDCDRDAAGKPVKVAVGPTPPTEPSPTGSVSPASTATPPSGSSTREPTTT